MYFYIYIEKRLEGNMSNLRCLLMVAFISSFIFSSILLGIAKFPAVGITTFGITNIICMKKRKTFLQVTCIEGGKSHSS